MSFKNKIVIITGSSSGIGAATAQIFAKKGASLALVGRNEKRLKEIADKCKKLGAATLTIQAELTNDQDVKGIVDKTIDRFGKLNVLVNNAGVLGTGSLLDGNLMARFNQIMDTNLRSVVLLTTHATSYLVKTRGNIVNVSSALGVSYCGLPTFMPYGLSKAALDHFTKGAALELNAVNVRVNAVTPGPTRTPVLEAAGINLTWEEVRQSFKLKRVSEPEEVGDLIAYLASDEAKSITGAAYVMDNGALIMG